MIKEIWKKIPNFSRYEASNFGKLRSSNYKNSGKTKVLKPALSSDGYLKTMLLNDQGVYKSWTVHKFITLAFYGLISKGLEINHIDGVKTNNNIDNLEYVTKSQNVKHAYDMGLATAQRGSLNGNSKLKESDVEDIRNTAKSGGRYYGRKNLAAKYNVSEAHIKDIVNRRRNIWHGV